MKAIRKLIRAIRKWWMLLTAPAGLVSYKGIYYRLIPVHGSPTLIAHPVKFVGLFGWEYDSHENILTFPNRYYAKRKTIIAKYYIEAVE